jgi:propanol-preferring alcohol dehydrogenase
MRAVVLDALLRRLRLADLADPEPGPNQVLLRVGACGVCRTDLHVLDGQLPSPKLRLVLGHQIVGRVVKTGPGAESVALGARLGVPWVGWTCGVCEDCASGRENLCRRARFTGYHLDGGFAELAVADQRFCFAVPEGAPDAFAAPLLCAGAIGYRSYRMAGEGKRQGLYAAT